MDISVADFAVILAISIVHLAFALEVKCQVDSISWFERAKAFGCNSSTDGEYHCSLLRNGSYVEMCMISVLILPVEGKTILLVLSFYAIARHSYM